MLDNTNMKSVTYKVGHHVDPVSGEVTMFLKNENWGPIITGKDYKTAKESFTEALSAGMIVDNILNIERAYKDGRLGEGLVKKMTDESTEFISKLDFDFASC